MRLLRRALLASYGLSHLGWGAWAYAAPGSFFATFPGFGQRWTADYPPYNEHLVVDLGSTFLTLGALLLIAAALDDRRVTTVVVAGAVLFAALHLAFHATHRGGMDDGYVPSLVTLAVGVVAPLLTLATYRYDGARSDGARSDATGR